MKYLNIIDEIDSTNAELARRLPLPHGYALLARHQHGGRGRQQRQWHSVPGDFTASFWFMNIPKPLSGFPLVAGLAVLDALAAHGLQARCKWPNDIRVRGRKVAGILASLATVDGKYGVILGVGVNLLGIRQDLPSLPYPVTSYQQETGCSLMPEHFFATLAIRLARRLRRWSRHGFAMQLAEWTTACDHMGQPVRVHSPDGTLHEGVTAGVGASGELLLRNEKGIHTVLCGDVELCCMLSGDAAFQ